MRCRAVRRGAGIVFGRILFINLQRMTPEYLRAHSCACWSAVGTQASRRAARVNITGRLSVCPRSFDRTRCQESPPSTPVTGRDSNSKSNQCKICQHSRKERNATCTTASNSWSYFACICNKHARVPVPGVQPQRAANTYNAPPSSLPNAQKGRNGRSRRRSSCIEPYSCGNLMLNVFHMT